MQREGGPSTPESGVATDGCVGKSSPPQILPSLVNRIKRYIYFFFFSNVSALPSQEEELHILLLFSLNIAGPLKAHVVFMLKIYVWWPIPSKVSRLIKITSFQNIM